MISLLLALLLSTDARAYTFASLKRVFRGDPVRMTIAPCEGDYACVEAGGHRYAMTPVGIRRDGYEIIAAAAPGQPGLLLIKTRFGEADELVLLLQDGAQVFGFHPAVNGAERPGVSAQVLAAVKSPDFRYFLKARTEDQVQARAESLVKRLRASHRAPIDVTREAVLLDIEHLFESDFISAETLARVRVLLERLHSDPKPVREPKILRKHLEKLSEQVGRDLEACGFIQVCAPRS